jgi:hypothetical protein
LARAWGVGFAAALLTTFIATGAVFSVAPGDRPAGTLLFVLLILGGLGVFPVREQPQALTRRFFAIACGQVLAAMAMVAGGWGTTLVILGINGILLACWLLAAVLFRLAARRPNAAFQVTHLQSGDNG